MTEMAFEDLEKTYDSLAKALDEAGVEKHNLLLARLVMILANQVGDSDQVAQAIREASDLG